MRGVIFGTAAIGAMSTFASRANAAFHLWALQEIYTNSSGNLQFIEMFDQFGGQEFVGGQQIRVTNSDGTQTHSFTIPTNLPDDSFDHTFLLGTAALQSAGGPAPDYILPDGFLFPGGGSISFFGLNSGTYSALPTDGTLSRTWGGTDNAVNSPQNFAGQTGVVTVPADTLGDFNRDGHVTAADIQSMVNALSDLRTYQSTQGLSNAALLALGDVDHNNAVNNADLEALLNKLKSGGGSGSFTAVPEPTAWALMAAAAVCVIGCLRLGHRAVWL
jgi:Dockerin type I domain